MQTLERSRLIREHLDYAGAVAAGLMSQLNLRGVVGYDDVLGYATVGLTNAADRFEPNRGTHFKTFSFRHIRGAVIDGLRMSHRSRRHHQFWKSSTCETRACTTPRPRDPTSWPPSPRWVAERGAAPGIPAFDPFPAVDDRLALWKAIDGLPELERQIILLHYFEELTDRRIGRRLGYPATTIVRYRLLAQRALAAALNGPCPLELTGEDRQ